VADLRFVTHNTIPFTYKFWFQGIVYHGHLLYASMPHAKNIS
jgi:hypothetical protein